jgi:hypothetical protein
MIRELWPLLAGSMVLLALGRGSVQAQTVAHSFEELRSKLKPGDTVYVTDDSGRERRAQILDFSPSSLILSVDGARRDLSEENVKRIRQRLPDPLWSGAVIGAAVAMAPLIVYCSQASESGETCGDQLFVAGGCDELCLGLGLVPLGAIGAAAGMGIDALVRGRKTIYEALGGTSPRALRVSPVFSSRARGVLVSMSF